MLCNWDVEVLWLISITLTIIVVLITAIATDTEDVLAIEGWEQGLALIILLGPIALGLTLYEIFKHQSMKDR